MALWRALLLSGLAVSISVALPATQEGVPAVSPPANEARGFQQQSRNSIQNSDDVMNSIYSDCLKKDSVSCVKYKLFSFVDKVLGSKESFTLTEGVTVVKNAGSPPEVSGDGGPRAIAGGNEETNKDFESMIVNRVERFLKTHTLKVDLKGNEVLKAVTSAGRALEDAADSLGLTEEEEVEDGRDASEERGKKKKVKMLLPLLLALKLKAAALIPLFLGAIALIAGKALLIGKIAFIISAIIGLKKLLSQQKSVTYEIVSHPHHSSSHHESYSSGGGGYGGDLGLYGGSGSGGHGGWGRSGVDAQQLAYRGYQQAS
ncbi:uncharacterized protein LOC111873814 [Cryptotermes secundus]|uniref:uncharacterized protein LOC111873814 n=1 Tax=Cryptotermes secundus TaxID=105785 RepID=UPI000CD7AF4B|nr:uncharacterized protein LOC111873814 [Cryptotermes secundus]